MKYFTFIKEKASVLAERISLCWTSCGAQDHDGAQGRARQELWSPMRAVLWGQAQATPGPNNGDWHIKVLLMGEGEAERGDVRSKSR